MMSQDDLYRDAAAVHGPALERLARSYEADPEERRDLLQEIHLALWRSLESFRSECSMRTWVYRVAHNVAASHAISDRRRRTRQVSLDEIAEVADGRGVHGDVDRQKTLEQLYALIRQLNPLDRQVILLYLEGMDAASIGEVTGISAGNTATKVHRIKKVLADRFKVGDCDAR